MYLKQADTTKVPNKQRGKGLKKRYNKEKIIKSNSPTHLNTTKIKEVNLTLQSFISENITLYGQVYYYFKWSVLSCIHRADT